MSNTSEIHRRRGAGEVREARILGFESFSDVQLLRSCGICNFNIDLIAGLSGQTRESWDHSLDWVERLEAPHVSVYMLEVDEDSRLGLEILGQGSRYGAGDVPDDELTVTLYERAVAGAEFTPINEGLAGYFGTDRGLLVVQVGPQTPAARAGLLSGDVITRVNGQVVDEVNDFRRAVGRAGNETLKVEILRKGKARTLEFQPRIRREP